MRRILSHGVYRSYTYGCRCDACRAAKAEYMRTRRATAARRRRMAEANGQGRNFVPGIKHGYAGYQDYHCRCPECCAATAAAYQEARHRRYANARAELTTPSTSEADHG